MAVVEDNSRRLVFVSDAIDLPGTTSLDKACLEELED